MESEATQPEQPMQPAPATAVSAAPSPGGYDSNPWHLISPSWHGVIKNFWDYVGVYLTFIIAAAILAIISIALFHITPLLGVIVGLVATVVGIAWFGVAVTRVILASAKNEHLPFRQAFGNLGLGLRLFGATILMVLAVAVGFILLVIPGLYVLVRLILVPYVVVEENLSPVAALRRSWHLTDKRFWDTAGAAFLLSAMSIIAIIPILGPIAVLVLNILLAPVPAVRYLQLKGLKDSNAPVPATSAWNYAVVVIALVAGVLVNETSATANLIFDARYHTR